MKKNPHMMALDDLKSACNDGLHHHLSKLISAKKVSGEKESLPEDAGEPVGEADDKLSLLEAYKKRK